ICARITRKMKTLEQFSKGLTTLPASVGWYLGDLGVAVGKQQMYTKQAPQKLKILREKTVIENAVSANPTAGVENDAKRVGTVLFGKATFKDRDEEEVRGYREALDLVHTEARRLSISERTIKHLHKLARGELWDSGKYRVKDADIIERYADGRERIR